MKQSTVFAVVLALAITATTAFGQELEQSAAPAAEPPPVEWTPGLIFTTDSILLNVSSFNGGIGGVMRSDDTAYRAAVGALASNAFSTIALKLGFWYVQYYWSDRLSPYWDLFAGLESLSNTVHVDDDNWTRDLSIDVRGGVAIGIEFFLLDVLSVFAEYSLSAMMSGTQTTTSVAGETSSDDFEWTYAVGTDLAHGGALGIALYLEPQVDLDSDNAE